MPRPTVVFKKMTVFAMLALLLCGAGAAAADVDNCLFARLLERYAGDGGVDSKGFKAAETELDYYRDLLAAVDLAQLTSEDRLAFYVSAYNAWAIKLILNHDPGIESIREAGSFFRRPWKKGFVRLEAPK
ncbi:MAG: hypothetical protein QNJ04_03825 [Desulfobacterales bacterium]|nr:hypothetical protein [Desulfobacterales bacterium]